MHAPPESVFQILSNIHGWPEWQNDVRVFSNATMQEGAEFKWTDSGMPINSRITVWQPFSELAIESKLFWLTSTTHWQIEPQEDGALIHCELTLEGFGAAMIKPIVAKNMELTMAELAKHAQSLSQLVYS